MNQHHKKMKEQHRSFSKPKIVSFYIFSFILVIYLISKITNSNSAEIDYNSDYAGNFAGSGGGLVAVRKLNELVEQNFLDRKYYEASAYEKRTWYRTYANYNKKHQAIFVGDSDGWTYFFYATPAELKMISDRKIAAKNYHLYLRPFPLKLLIEIPTRSRDLFSVF